MRSTLRSWWRCHPWLRALHLGWGERWYRLDLQYPPLRFENEYPHSLIVYSLVPQQRAQFQEAMEPLGGGAHLGEGRSLGWREGIWEGYIKSLVPDSLSLSWSIEMWTAPTTCSHPPPHTELLCYAFPAIDGLISLKPGAWFHLQFINSNMPPKS